MGRRVSESRVSEARANVIRAEARRVLAESGTHETAEIDLDALCAALGVEVVYADLEGAAARVLKLKHRTRITVSNRIGDAGAVRFSIAHELAHLLLDHVLVNEGAPLVDRLCHPLSAGENDVEREANLWATELLMPEPFVRAYCDLPGATMQQIRALARACRTSQLASAIRFVELTSEPCAIAYCQLGRISWAKRSRTFSHWIPKGRTLDPVSAAAEYFRGNPIGDYPRVITADAWLSGRATEGSTLQIAEHASIVPEVGAVFSLLWLPANDIQPVSTAA